MNNGDKVIFKNQLNINALDKTFFEILLKNISELSKKEAVQNELWKHKNLFWW